MIFCAWLMKLSFDLLISLGLQTPCGIRSSYESLGEAAYGHKGRTAVLVSKGIFCFGGLIAIVVIVKDNFGPSMRHLLGETTPSDDDNWLVSILLDDKHSTFILSAAVMLPLSLLRDMTPLERFSAVKVFSFMMILAIVVYLWATLAGNDPEMVPARGHFFERWLQVRPG
jgi:amino acid permease